MAARNLDGILEKKSEAIFREILEPLDMITTRQWNTLGWKSFNIPYLVEKAFEIASGGLYECINTDGYDFTDFSDAKTVSITDQKRTVFELTAVENKVGALRIVCYNECRDRLHYFYIPYNAWQEWVESDYRKSHPNGKRIRSYYSKGTDQYKRLDPFRYNTFEEIAKLTDDKYYQRESIPMFLDRGNNLEGLYVRV